MTDDLIKRAREALDGVTPRPWSVGKTHPHKVSRGGEYIANADPNHRNQPICDANARFIAAARDLVPAMADRIEALEAEVERLRAEALDVQPGFTADDLRRAWELCRDAAARKCNSEVEFLHREADYAEQTSRNRLADQYEARAIACKEMAGSIRAMTPPANLADKVKEGEG